MMELTFPVSPVAASRPRVSKFGSYYAGAYKRFRHEAAPIVIDMLGVDFEPLDGPLSVDIECYCTRPKTTKLDAPKPDVDNMAKAILDLLNKKLWIDDSQIRSLRITKQWNVAGEPGYFTLGVSKL